jgi:hypothetical protein
VHGNARRWLERSRSRQGALQWDGQLGSRTDWSVSSKVARSHQRGHRRRGHLVEVVRGCIVINCQQQYCRAVLLTCGISDPRALAVVAITPAKDTEIIALVAAQRDGLDDGRRDCAQEQQYEGEEEYDGQRCCRAQHGGRRWSGSNECGCIWILESGFARGSGRQPGRWWRWRVPGRRARAQTDKRSDWLRPAIEHTDGIDMGWLGGGMVWSGVMRRRDELAMAAQCRSKS